MSNPEAPPILSVSVRWKLLLTLTVVAVLAVGPAVWLAVNAVSREQDHARETLELTAELAARHADHILVEAFFELEALARRTETDPISSSLDAGPPTNFTTPVILLDGAGKPETPIPGWPDSGDELRAVLAPAAESQDRSVSAPFTNPATGHPASALGLPLFRDDGARAGTVVGFLDLEQHIAADLADTMARLGPSVHADLVGPGGIVLASTEHEQAAPWRHPEFYRLADESRQTIIGEAEAATSGSPASVQHVMAYVPMGAAPWGVAAGGDRKDIYREADDLRRQAMQLGVPALVVLILGFALVSVEIGRPGDRRPSWW